MHKPPIIFKGIEIEPLTFSRRALLISIVDLNNMDPMEVATALYCLFCPRKELIAAKSNRLKFTELVADWVDKVEFSPADGEEAGKVLKAILEDSKENEVQPILAADFEQDPDTGDGLGKR
jgi:hypothetical protein